jgi:DnaK suppressor protein
MDAIQGQAMSAETQRRRLGELSRVKAALKRILDNAYGLCLECEDTIEARRLEHNPAQPLCIDCARARDR